MLVRVNDLYENTQLHELIAEVDSWPREPTEEDIQYLAKKYGDTEEYVRYTFRVKRWRQDAKKNQRQATGKQGRAKKKHHFFWLDEEVKLVEENWRAKTDKELAEELSRLPCNLARGVTRTPRMVLRLRERRGWSKWGLGEVLEEEREFVRAHWREMDDYQLADALTQLDCNTRRGIVRSMWAARAIRLNLGLRRRNGRKANVGAA